MIRKIIFSDLDGTLVEKNDLIEPEIGMLIEEFRKENIFVINTGRNIDEAFDNIVKLGIGFDYMILNNGGHIIDSQKKDVIKREINRDTAKKVMATLKARAGLNITFYNGAKTYLQEAGLTKVLTESGFVASDEDFDAVFEQSATFDIICAYQTDGRIDELKLIIEELEQLDVTCNLNDIYLDISPEGSTKGNGASYLLEYLDFQGISYGIGDSYNDVSMFREVDCGVTFKHCLKEIKAEADLVVASVGELIKKVG